MINPDKNLQDLSESRDPGVRRQAIVQLSALPADDRIARALLTARLFDADTTVREAAARALQTPALRRLLAARPELQREAIEAGANAGGGEAGAPQALIREFERRRSDQVRMSYGALALLVILFVILWLRLEPLAPLAYILTLALVAGYALFSWQNWRCPRCGTNFWARKPRIDPWQTRGEARCPQCGAQLRHASK